MLTAHSKQCESICYSCILSWGSVRMRDHFHLSFLASSNMGPWVSSWDCFRAGRVVNGQLLTDAPSTAVQPWPPGPCSHVLPLILGLSGLWLGCLFSPDVCVLNVYHACYQYITAHQTPRVPVCHLDVLARVHTMVCHKLWPPWGEDQVCENLIEWLFFNIWSWKRCCYGTSG